MKEYGIGIVGCGFMGKVHAYCHKAVPFYYKSLPCKTRLIGACASRETSARELKEQGDFLIATTDYKELLQRKDIQIIECCLPNHLHKQLLIDTIKAGKHVYCDKPLALNVKEGEEICALARKSEVKHQLAFQYRFMPHVTRAKQLIEEGVVGEISSFRSSYLHASCVTGKKKAYSWKAEYEKVGGGVLVDLGSHLIDLLTYLLGDFKQVKGFVRNFTSPDNRTDDWALLNIETESGAVGTMEASKMATGTNDDLRVEIHGSKGALRFASMDPNWLEFYDNTEEASPIGGLRGFRKIETVQRFTEPQGIPMPKVSIGWIRGHVASLYSFLDAVANDKKTSPDFEDGLKVQKIIETAYRSAE